jgi:hypothetical protein
MLLVACAVVFELCLAVVLWRVSSQRPSLASEIASVFIGFAAACSIGLAAQGFFLLAVNVLQISELAPTVFWLTAGVLAFAVALALKPSRVSASMPCMIVAAVALIYSILRQDEMTAVVGAVLIVSAIAVWSCARRVARRPKEPLVTEHAQ